MNTVNVESEYRKHCEFVVWSLGALPKGYSVSEFVDDKVRSGEWVEDDGEYFTVEEWDAERLAAGLDDEDEPWSDEEDYPEDDIPIYED